MSDFQNHTLIVFIQYIEVSFYEFINLIQF